jgi:cephalosporin hydroxylase
MAFSDEVRRRIEANAKNPGLQESANAFLGASIAAQYSYNFSWLGRPIIQYPQDIVLMQELVFQTRPDLIIETGIAHGGSLVLSASLLALLDYTDAAEAGTMLDPAHPRRRVLGVDIDIRPHNRAAIEAHPMRSRIEMIEGSSIASDIVKQVREKAAGHRRVLVCLDSNHTHDHVLAELEAYAPLVTVESYCCVFDTVIQDLPAESFGDRPWAPGNNPKTAVQEYLSRLAAAPQTGVDGRPLRFEVDKAIDHKLLVSVAPDGYLRRIAA